MFNQISSHCFQDVFSPMFDIKPNGFKLKKILYDIVFQFNKQTQYSNNYSLNSNV